MISDHKFTFCHGSRIVFIGELSIERFPFLCVPVRTISSNPNLDPRYLIGRVNNVSMCNAFKEGAAIPS